MQKKYGNSIKKDSSFSNIIEIGKIDLKISGTKENHQAIGDLKKIFSNKLNFRKIAINEKRTKDLKFVITIRLKPFC